MKVESEKRINSYLNDKISRLNEFFKDIVNTRKGELSNINEKVDVLLLERNS